MGWGRRRKGRGEEERAEGRRELRTSRGKSCQQRASLSSIFKDDHSNPSVSFQRLRYSSSSRVLLYSWPLPHKQLQGHHL